VQPETFPSSRHEKEGRKRGARLQYYYFLLICTGEEKERDAPPNALFRKPSKKKRGRIIFPLVKKGGRGRGHAKRRGQATGNKKRRRGLPFSLSAGKRREGRDL